MSIVDDADELWTICSVSRLTQPSTIARITVVLVHRIE
jgi:hypothetical protein